ncbi:MAG: nitroreductase family protein, partial [Candidatus Eremiobacteraeota bacterium]|nr:nitroreductase family protein [Candidatus Eremiobacteraeota bacterium]
MKKILTLIFVIFLLTSISCVTTYSGPETINLPSPNLRSSTSVEEALLKRRSVRRYKDEGLSLAEVGQLLWAAQGITAKNRFRTAPSAGAIYPMETFIVAGDVK